MREKETPVHVKGEPAVRRSEILDRLHVLDRDRRLRRWGMVGLPAFGAAMYLERVLAPSLAILITVTVVFLGILVKDARRAERERMDLTTELGEIPCEEENVS